MKKTIIISIVIAIAFLAFAGICKMYNDYIITSEELLWTLEEMCEQNNLPWEDTICETDQWSDYCDARKQLGLDYFEHYSKK